MRISREHYKVREINGAYELPVNITNDLEIVKSVIDHTNEKAVAEGFDAHQYIITKTEIDTYYDDKGFHDKTTREYRVEVYPDG